MILILIIYDCHDYYYLYYGFRCHYPLNRHYAPFRLRLVNLEFVPSPLISKMLRGCTFVTPRLKYKTDRFVHIYGLTKYALLVFGKLGYALVRLTDPFWKRTGVLKIDENGAKTDWFLCRPWQGYIAIISFAFLRRSTECYPGTFRPRQHWTAT